MWSTKAHNYLIDRFGAINGYTSVQIDQIKAGSRYADSIIAGFQGADYSFIHAMTSDSITSKKEACKLANEYIDEKLMRFQEPDPIPQLINSIKDYRFFQLGMGLHTIMDSTSPVHRGFQPWDSSQTPFHGPSEFMGIDREHTQESLSVLLGRPDIISQTLDLMNSALNGGKIDCSCY